MITGVTGQWESSLSINGQPIAVNMTHFREISIRAGLHRSLPTFSIKVRDAAAEIMSRAGIRDGSPVELMVGDGNGKNFKGNFKIIGGPQQLKHAPGGVVLAFNGVFDAVPWMRKVTTDWKEGLSGDMIKFLAGQAGLRTEIDPTNDKQVWLPNRRPLVEYARKVADHGWASNSSCMLMCINEKGVLKYKNLERLIAGGIQKRFGRSANIDHLVTQVLINDKSGAYNQSGAYGSTSTGEKLPGIVYELNKILGIRMANVMNFSSLLSTAMGRFGGRVDFNPIDSGNTHKKYHEAAHQNRRIKSMFGLDAHILVPGFTGTDLLSLVNWDAMSPAVDAGYTIPGYSGNYLVTNKVMTIRGNQYVEKLTLTTNGTA